MKQKLNSKRLKKSRKYLTTKRLKKSRKYLTSKRVKKSRKLSKSHKKKQKGGNREVYLHFTCAANRNSILLNGLQPNSQPLIDQGTESFRPLALLNGIINEEGKIEFENQELALRVLCFILYNCCYTRYSNEGVILYCFEPTEQDEIYHHPELPNEYYTNHSIHPDRLKEMPPWTWPLKLAYMTILEPCGETKLCNKVSSF